MLFHWKSKYLSGWARGDIFVEAVSIERAREIALEKYKAHVLEHRMFAYEGWEPDEYDLERMEEYLAILQKDLEVEPTVYTDEAVFVEGSS